MNQDGTLKIFRTSQTVFDAMRNHQDFMNKLSKNYKTLPNMDEIIGNPGIFTTGLMAMEPGKASELIKQIALRQDQLAKSKVFSSGISKFFEKQMNFMDKLSRMYPTEFVYSSTALNHINASSIVLSKVTYDYLSILSRTNITENTMTKLLGPISYQSNFLSSAKKALMRVSNPVVSRAYQSSLDITSRSLLETTRELKLFADTTVVPDDLSLSRSYNIGQAIVRDQSMLVDEDNLAEHMIDLSSEQILVKAHSLLHLIVECNQVAQLSGQHEIFKPTTQIMMAFADIPMIIATNKNRFAELIDCLFFMLYEGAGDDKLRYIASHGGPLDDDDCKVIWAIKAFRNKWLRHDPDHGDQKRINKSWADLNEQFLLLGVSSIPNRRYEFMKLQMGLFNEAEKMLLTLLDRLKLQNIKKTDS